MEKKYKSYTNIGFESGSFLRGMLRAFDIYGMTGKKNRQRYLSRSNRDYIEADWKTTGNDLRKAIHDGKRK